MARRATKRNKKNSKLQTYAGGIGCLFNRSAEEARAPISRTRASIVVRSISERGRRASPWLIRSRTQGGASSGFPAVARHSCRDCFGVKTPSKPPPSLWKWPTPFSRSVPSMSVATAAFRAMGAAAHQERSSARSFRVFSSSSPRSRHSEEEEEKRRGGLPAGSVLFLLEFWLLSTHVFACLAMVLDSTPTRPQILRASFHLELLLL